MADWSFWDIFSCIHIIYGCAVWFADFSVVWVYFVSAMWCMGCSRFEYFVYLSAILLFARDIFYYNSSFYMIGV